MKGKSISKRSYKNNQVLKKKFKTHKSLRSVNNSTAEEDNYLLDIYNNPDLTDYREPVWDGENYLPTGSVEEHDDSVEESEAPDDDPMDNEPALPGHYKIKRRLMEVEEDDEQAVAKFITSSNPGRHKVKKDKNKKVLNQILPSEDNNESLSKKN